MKINLKKLDKKIFSDLKTIGAEAERLGFVAYLVGGVVRDLLLGRPSCDWDIVVEGQAIELAKKIAERAKAKITVYQQFGTATLNFPNGVSIDFATARSEYYPQPGALPVVKSGSIKEDLFRRDFTINALAIVLNSRNFGELQDFYSGYTDLRKKVVRVLHAKSFIDDPTRVLRAVRFESRLGFRLEKETLSLIKAAVKNKSFAAVKPPRYFAEFRKTFTETFPARCLKKLAARGGFDFIVEHFKPSLTVLSKLEKNSASLRKDKFYRQYDWSKAFLLAFFVGASLKQILILAKHFHLTKNEVSSLAGLAEFPEILEKLKAPRLCNSEIYELLDPVDLEIIYFIRATTSVNIVARRIDEFLQKLRLISLQITGNDLQREGFQPGREMGALLHTLLMKKIDGKIKTRHDEIALVTGLAVENFGD